MQTNVTLLLAFWGFFGVFYTLWCILLKTWSFWGHLQCTYTCVIVGTMSTEGPTDVPPSAYLCHPSCLLSKYHPIYVYPRPIGARATAVTHFPGAPKMTVFSPKCAKVHKIHQKGQKKAKNRVKFVCTHFPDPPTSPNRPEGWFLGLGFDNMCPKTELQGPCSTLEGPESACIRF